MSRWMLPRLIIGWSVALGLCAGMLAVGHAQAAGPVAVQISFRSVEPTSIGNATTVVVSLRAAGGPALADEPVELSIDGKYYRRARTDASGAASFPIPNTLVAGKHPLSAFYPGTSNTYLPATTTSSLEVTPYLLVIQTLPVLPGMGYTLDGKRFEAGADGYARISVATPGDHVLVALDEAYDTNGTRAQFARWSVNNEYSRTVTVSIPKVGLVQAGFDVFRPASQVFVDPSGGVVQPDRITSFTLRSSLGQVFTFTDGRAREYKASRVVRRSSGLESVDVRYNVTDVEVDGSNVVNEGQQHFFPTPGAEWQISLLLYSAQVEAKDALFGFSAGNTVTLTLPNGTSQEYAVGKNGEVVIPWLARGIYRVGVVDPPGLAPTMPVALSRDQQVQLRVISYLDMGLVGFAVLAVVFGLLYRGRPHLIRDSVGAAGGYAARLRRWSPRADRGAVERGRSFAAAPPAAANPEPQQAEDRSERRVQIAPLLASIAPRSALDMLDRPPVGRSRSWDMDAPTSPDLIDLAPTLFGPAEPATLPSAPEPAKQAKGTGNGKTPRSAVGASTQAGAERPARARRARATASDEPTSDAKRDAAPAPGASKRAPIRTGPRTRPASRATSSKRATGSTKTGSTKTAASKSTASKSGAKRDVKTATATATANRGAGRAVPKTGATKSTATKSTATKSTASKGAANRDVKASPAARGTARTTRRTSAKNAAPVATKSTAAKRATTPARSDAVARSKPSETRRNASERVASSVPAARPGRQAEARRAAKKKAPAPAREARTHSARAGAVPTSDVHRQVGSADTEVARMQACRNCGFELWVGAQFCRRCGQPTEAGDAPEVSSTPKVARARRSSGGKRSPRKADTAAQASPSTGGDA